MVRLGVLGAIAILIVSSQAIQAEESCSTTICQLTTKLGQESYKREKFETDMKVFTIDHSLKSGQANMERFLYGIGKIIEIEGNVPLQAYVIQYQQQLHEEAQENLKLRMEFLFLHIKNAQTTIVQKIDNHFNKSLQENEMERLNKKLKMETLKNKNLTEELKNIKRTLSPTSEPSIPSDCWDIQNSGQNNTSGVYTIYPKGQPFKVYCDMDTAGGGWTVFILRQRQDRQLNFTRNWKDYKDGFGSPPNEYWLGLEALHMMTSIKKYSLRSDAVGEGTPSTTWGEYSTFKVDSEMSMYRLTIGGYNVKSTMKDFYGFGYANTHKFSTIDRDNDIWHGGNCVKAVEAYGGRGGGFWFSNCARNVATHPYSNFKFYHWSKVDDNPRRVTALQMKIRPQTIKKIKTDL